MSLFYLQVPVPESVKPRRDHSLTATSLGPGLTEVLLFGGEKLGGDRVAETIILRFGKGGYFTLYMYIQLGTPLYIGSKNLALATKDLTLGML